MRKRVYILAKFVIAILVFQILSSRIIANASSSLQGVNILIADFDQISSKSEYVVYSTKYLIEALKPLEEEGIHVEKFEEAIEDDIEARYHGNEYGYQIVLYGWFDLKTDLYNIYIQLIYERDSSGKKEIDSIDNFLMKLTVNDLSCLPPLLIGLIRYQRGEDEEAIASFSSALSYPSKVAIGREVIYLYKGNSHYWQEQKKEAISAYQSALSIEPNLSAAHYNLGIIYGEEGRLDEAVISLQNALALKLDKSISSLQSTMELSPDFAAAHNNLGISYYNQGKIDEAIAEYKVALGLNPNFAEAHNNLGLVYRAQGKIEEAIAEYKRAIEIKSYFAEAYNNLGLAYYGKGMLKEAIAQYQKALKFKPYFAAAHSNLGIAYYDKGWLDEAIAQYQKALKFDSNSAEIHYNLGVAYRAKDKLDETIEELSKAIALKPDLVEAHYNLGAAYRKKGEKEKAINQFEMVIKLLEDGQLRRMAMDNIIKLEE